MSRATRRHPTKQKAGRQGRQRAPTISTSAKKRPQQREVTESRGLLSALRPRFAEDIISELRKVTWPSREETWYLTFVVLVVASFFGVFLGGVDMFFNWAIDNTLLR